MTETSQVTVTVVITQEKRRSYESSHRCSGWSLGAMFICNAATVDFTILLLNRLRIVFAIKGAGLE